MPRAGPDSHVTNNTDNTNTSGKLSSNLDYIGCYLLYIKTSETTLHRVIWGDIFDYYFFLQTNQAACGCIVKGLGKQKIGAVCNLVGYYAVGFPIGISLMFAAKWGIFGKTNMQCIIIMMLINYMQLINTFFNLNIKKLSVFNNIINTQT